LFVNVNIFKQIFLFVDHISFQLTLICCKQVVKMNFHSHQSTCQCLHEEIGWSFFSLIWEYSEMLELICVGRQRLFEQWITTLENL